MYGLNNYKNEERVAIVMPYVAHYRHAMFRELILSLNKIGVQVDVYAGLKPDVPALSIIDPVSLPSEDPLKASWRIVRNIWVFKYFLIQPGVFLKMLRGYDSVIFFGNMYYLSTWVASLLVKFRGGRVYFWSHGFRYSEKGFKGWLRDLFYNISDGMFLFGERARVIMSRRGHSPDKLHVIYNSLDYEAHLRILSKLKKSGIVEPNPERLQIVAVGRLTAGRRIDMLLTAAKSLLASYRGLQVVIIGDGPERAKVEERIRELGLEETVNMVGASYDEEEVARWIYSSHVSCIPGDIGLFGIHSMTFGVPVITHDDFSTQGPEAEIIVEYETGGFYENGNIDSLCEKIKYWLDKMSDANQAEEVRRLCQERVRLNFTPHSQADAIVKELCHGGNVA